MKELSMNRTSLPRVFAFLVLISAFGVFAQAQQAAPGFAAVSNAQASPPNVIAFSDTLSGQADGALTATFALYPDPQSTTPAWTETQAVQVSQGKYTVLLGAATTNGIPADIFAADQAHWLGVQINGTEKRYLLVSVPYAMKAMEAERLGGLLPSQFVTTAQLQAALQTAATPGSSTTAGGGTKTISGPVANASLNPAQPATDFTDNNTSEVLLVTQQGAGFAIHAISAGDAALFGENNTPTGTAVKALASSTSGTNIGLLAQSASPNGIAGVFDNIGSGQILSLRSNGNEVASVDNAGDIKGNIVQANAINANFLSGNGSGLFNIPNSATTATTVSAPNTIVLRDSGGGTSVNYINANFISGNGSGLFNIPNSATTATTVSAPDTIVQRDSGGGISVNYINANFLSGNGSGLFNIPNSATTATTVSAPNTIVLRDAGAGISANYVNSNFFAGNGGGLFNIPNSATTATAANTPNAIVARDGGGGFTANFIQAFGLSVGAGGLSSFGVTDFTSGTTAPVHAVLSANVPTSCMASKELLIKTDAVPGQQLFICNATGDGYVLVGDGTAAGVTSVGAGDGSVAIGGTAAAPTVAVANGGITSAKLAPNAVVGSIADGSLTPAKIAGTAATLGANTFTGTQTMPVVNAGSLTVSGNITGTGGGSISGSTFIQTAAGTALSVVGGDAINPGFTAMNPANGGIGLQGTSIGNSAIGVLGRATGGQSVAGLFINSQGNGRIISAEVGSGTSGSEVFSVDTAGNMFNGGALVASFPGSTSTTTLAGLAKLDVNGFAVSTAPGDTTGAVGVVLPLGGTTSSVRIAYGGTVFCVFDSVPHIRDYVQISRTTTGECADVGPNYPTSGQVIGRVTGVASGTGGFVLLSGPSTQAINGGVATINTGPGLVGGPITTSGTISIANAGVTNAMLQNSVVTVNAGLGLSGGGLVSLGGLVTLSNAGALSFNGRTGSIISQPGDYSFGQIAGTLAPNQLPAALVYNNQSNTFTADQTINGTLTTNSLNTNSLTTTSLTVNVPNRTTAMISGSAIGGWPVFSVFDTGAASPGVTALFAASSHNLAAQFSSSGPDILSAGTLTGHVLDVSVTGVTVFGNVSATTFSGDGSALANVNASSIGGTTLANLATASALNAETAARQSGDTTLQNNINSESSARQSADASLATSISAETAARQSDTSNLQTSINNLSAADAKLATANTFTASNTFTGGTQDFSAAAATLPVRALPSAQTPATCVASKELLIKTDAPAGQQLFLCDAGGTTWNLVGDGASGGVTSFNGRNGTVTPSSGDYSFSQISGSVATSQLPANVAYNNQANTFSASQTVNGNLTATAFIGNGGGLSNVNAATLNGVASTSFAQLGANSNTFTGSLTAASFSGNGSALTDVNAATVNNFQMLKLTASITPASVNHQTCSEQNFTVSGVNSGDVLLSVQPSGHSPGTNIAVGGWRVAANNTVAIQFCNVSSGTSTPAAATYIFALMR
jgi:trimeric autotransporter adhesin